jgi:hypothetical protein
MLLNVYVPPTNEMGCYKFKIRTSATETKSQAALWDYNSARAHDGLEPVRRMPNGTIYNRPRTWVIQGFYNGEWEDETEEVTRKDCLAQLKLYRENSPAPCRMITRYLED